jgi:NTP pyrophosphatase (non-canonical NTP hydrolase)
MDLKIYQERASKTAIFPNEKAMEYLALGMTSEAGEVAGKVKKLIRDGADQEGLEQARIDIALEVGDVMWYCAMLAKEIDTDLESIMFANLSKLEGRQKRNTLHGEGDHR